MSVERDVLRLCLRARHDAAAWRELCARAERDALDWDRLSRLAVGRRVAPLLHGLLRDAAFVPDAARRRLRGAYLANAHRNVVLLHEVEAVVAALERAGVETIVLKGAALIRSVYGDAAVRPLMDVDLLVRRRDLPAALEVVAGLGFAPHRAGPRDYAVAEFESELLVVKPGPVPVPVELHWSLFDSPYYQERIDLDFCWRTAAPLRFGETPTRMLGPTAQLLHLCGHLVLHHGGEDLLWETDIAEVVRLHGTAIDWDALCRWAAELDLVIALQRTLLGPTTGGIAIPSAGREALTRLRPSAGEARIVADLTAGHRGVGRRFWSDLRNLTGTRARLAYAWAHLLPSAAYMRARYGVRHAILLPLYYPYRWWRGLRGFDAHPRAAAERAPGRGPAGADAPAPRSREA